MKGVFHRNAAGMNGLPDRVMGPRVAARRAASPRRGARRSEGGQPGASFGRGVSSDHLEILAAEKISAQAAANKKICRSMARGGEESGAYIPRPGLSGP